MRRIGFLVNPIAGMGGRVGLKGTNGVLTEAIARGASPVSPGRALEMLTAFRKDSTSQAPCRDVSWLTCSIVMGEQVLRSSGFADAEFEIVYRCSEPTTATDTRKACSIFLDRGAELIVFCGGDGTARDVLDEVGQRIPILGIPAGVKMHSAVFAVNPPSAANVLVDYLDGRLVLAEAEVLDIDEEKYRQGEWKMRLFGMAKTPYEPSLVQAGKMLVEEASEEDIKEAIAKYVIELMEEERDALFILGPGSTVKHIAKKLKIDGTLLGIDAVCNGRIVERDVDERTLLNLMSRFKRRKLVLSPIGAQGFVLGRGNLQASPEVIRNIGIDNIIIVATPAKLARTECLRVDTGDRSLDADFARKKYVAVIVSYRMMRMHPIVA